jgi:hypothetical protein
MTLRVSNIASHVARLRPILMAFALSIVITSIPTPAQTRPPIVEQIAKTYGIDSWGQIEAIRYTWNGEITGLFKASRKWEWEPKTGKVTFEGKDKDGKLVNVTYTRAEINALADAAKKEADADPSARFKSLSYGFANDNYWLLFPLHAYWDTGANITDQGMKKLPTGAGSATLVSVKYPAELGGYTPGDTWDLYVGKNNRVEALVFRHGGDKKPSLVTSTWTGYKKAGPLLISTEHRGTADGKPLHIFISDVAVKVTGSDTWVEAK